MIDERINNSLRELEQGLKDIESARKQVEKTVNSYDGLKQTTDGYVSILGNVTTKIKEIVDYIGKDYDQKVKAFEKDRASIFDSTNAATKKLSEATDGFEESLYEIKKNLKFCLIITTVSLIAIMVTVVLLLK